MNTATGRASFVFASALIAGALLAIGPAANQAQSGTVSAQQARPDVMTSDYVGQEDDLFADAFKRPAGRSSRKSRMRRSSRKSPKRSRRRSRRRAADGC